MPFAANNPVFGDRGRCASGGAGSEAASCAVPLAVLCVPRSTPRTSKGVPDANGVRAYSAGREIRQAGPRRTRLRCPRFPGHAVLLSVRLFLRDGISHASTPPAPRCPPIGTPARTRRSPRSHPVKPTSINPRRLHPWCRASRRRKANNPPVPCLSLLFTPHRGRPEPGSGSGSQRVRFSTSDYPVRKRDASSTRTPGIRPNSVAFRVETSCP